MPKTLTFPPQDSKSFYKNKKGWRRQPLILRVKIKKLSDSPFSQCQTNETQRENLIFQVAFLSAELTTLLSLDVLGQVPVCRSQDLHRYRAYHRVFSNSSHF